MKYCIVLDEKTRQLFKDHGHIFNLDYSCLYTIAKGGSTLIMANYDVCGEILLFNNKKSAKEYIKGLDAAYENCSFNIIDINIVKVNIAEWKLRQI